MKFKSWFSLFFCLVNVFVNISQADQQVLVTKVTSTAAGDFNHIIVWGAGFWGTGKTPAAKVTVRLSDGTKEFLRGDSSNCANPSDPTKFCLGSDGALWFILPSANKSGSLRVQTASGTSYFDTNFDLEAGPSLEQDSFTAFVDKKNITVTQRHLPVLVTTKQTLTIIPNTTPIPIYTADQLMNMKNNLSANYILMRDIDLDKVKWVPIGSSSNIAKSKIFHGHLNGNGKRIFNLKRKPLFTVFGGAVTNLSLHTKENMSAAFAYRSLYGAIFSKINLQHDGSFVGIDTYDGGLVNLAIQSTFHQITANVTTLVKQDNVKNYGYLADYRVSNVGGLIGQSVVSILSQINVNYKMKNMQGHSREIGGIVGLLSDRVVYIDVSSDYMREIPSWTVYPTIEHCGISESKANVDFSSIYNELDPKTGQVIKIHRTLANSGGLVGQTDESPCFIRNSSTSGVMERGDARVLGAPDYYEAWLVPIAPDYFKTKMKGSSSTLRFIDYPTTICTFNMKACKSSR